MENSHAKFKYSLNEGILELEGSEDFISKHFSSLSSMIEAMSINAAGVRETKIVSLTAKPPDTFATNTVVAGRQADVESISDYPTIYAESNGKLKLVTDIKGDSLRSKMSNIALMYLYGAHLIGNEEVSSREIREVCEMHGCLDSGNFTKAFDDKTLFLADGVKGGTKNIKLTFTGKKRAKELLVDG